MPAITKKFQLVNRGAAGLLTKPAHLNGDTVVAPNKLWETASKDNIRCEGEIVDISTLVLDPMNAKKHPERNMAAIKDSLCLHGQMMPIVVRSETRVVMAGNGRLTGARELGWTKLAISLISMTDKEAAAYGVNDNRSSENGLWDWEVLQKLDNIIRESDTPTPLVGWSTDEMLALRKSSFDQPQEDDDEVPATLERPISSIGDIWLVRDHRIMCGSSTEEIHVASLLNQHVPCLMVTDPPYGVEYDANWRNDRARAGVGFGAPGCRAVGRVMNDEVVNWNVALRLFPGNVMYVWHASSFTGKVAAAIENIDFKIRYQLIWNKTHIAISRGHYHWKHEPCFYAVRNGSTANWIGDRSQCSVWNISNRIKEDRTNHSTQKPVECMERPIINHGGDVYDPFLGVGTTVIAAHKQNRTCYGMELNPLYVDVAVRRIMAYTGDDAIRESDGASFREISTFIAEAPTDMFAE